MDSIELNEHKLLKPLTSELVPSISMNLQKLDCERSVYNTEFENLKLFFRMLTPSWQLQFLSQPDALEVKDRILIAIFCSTGTCVP